ncbi:DinB family protein [uncultured Dokdonia sp.]|uniref:DinB family protein n=1 Tax=Dokdonia sp. Asnod2-E02 TaxID=3160574 RepID=UPI002615106C|nr:DinB family protein [uncultured Dokdonia sp.]
MTTRAEVKEPEYNTYYNQYISQVPEETDLLEALQSGLDFTVSFYNSLSEEQLLLRYAPGKWTPKEVLLHLIDTERIFSYRALRFSRMDATPLQGFEQDDFVASSNANERTISSLLEEYASVRLASLSLFTSMTKETVRVIGEASQSPLSPRAAGFIIAGHERHHITIIKERYL